MKSILLLLLAALLVPGCTWEPSTHHATIANQGTMAVEVHVVFSFNGEIVREETRSLEVGESFEFSLDHPQDGRYRLVAETEDGRSAEMTPSWQGSSGSKVVEFIIHDDRIEALHGV